MAFDTTVVVSSTDEAAVPVSSPSVPETPAPVPESAPDRPRDEHGRFVSAPEDTAAAPGIEPAPAAEETPTPDGATPTDPVVEPPAKKGSPQHRINQAIAKQRDAERRAEAVEQELQTLRAKYASPADPVVPPADPTPPADAGPPREDQFDTWEAYTKASVVYEARQEVLRLRQEEQTRLATEAQQKATQAMLAEHAKRVEQGRGAHADWEEVVGNPNIKTSPPMEDAILTSPVGEELMYYLGKNPAEAARINALSPAQALKEMGKIEARVEAALKSTGPASHAPATRTPPPIVPVGGGSHITTIDPEQMTPLEYHRWRNEQRSKMVRY